MVSNIPQNRIILYALLLGLLPIVLAVFNFISKQGGLESLVNGISYVQQQADMKERKQAINVALKQHFRDTDHFYIDKNLETLQFLEPEVEALQKIMSNKNFPDDDTIKKRYEYLTGGGNSLLFSEGAVQSTSVFQEMTETIVHPVEVDISDIQKILAKVEGVEIGSHKSGPSRPQLLILDFKIEKKKSNEKNEVYSLNMKLLKREFL